MTKEEIKEYLKENLEINTSLKEVEEYYDSDKNYYKVEIIMKLEGEVFTSSYDYT